MSTDGNPGLTPDLLARAFPFFLAWDGELRVTAAGPSLAKVCPRAVPGARLDELFRLKRPEHPLDAAWLRGAESLLLLLEYLPTGLILRGQVVPVESTGGSLLLASPWLSEPAEVERLGLSVADFAQHDQTFDLLQVVQTQRMANADLQRLAGKLTEQRARLRRQEAEARKLALVAARTDNAVIVTDALRRIEWVNDGFTRITGWTLAEVAGRSPGEILQGPNTSAETVAMMRDCLNRGEAFSTELVNYDRHGRAYWVALEVQPVLNEAGALVNFMAVESDITGRVRQERRRSLQLAAARILAAAAGVDETAPLLLAALGGRMGWTTASLWLPEHGDGELRLAHAWQAPAAGLAGFADPARWPRGASEGGAIATAWTSGRRAWLADLAGEPGAAAAAARAAGLNTALVLPLPGGARTCGVLAFHGTRVEEPDEPMWETLEGIALQTGQFLVRRRAEEEMVRAKEAAEAANRAKSDFLATMSHEIRTPMNGVLGFTQLLQQTALTGQQGDFVAAIRSSAESLLSVINDVLDFSKIESGRMELESRPFALIACVEEALETVSTSAAEKRLDLAARLGAAVPASVTGDALRLRQILVNLLGNAVKFTPSGEVRLTIEAAPAASGRTALEFRVSDTGIGIPADKLATLFQPFRQGDRSTSRHFGGSGLGLAICRRLAGLMGGTITADSRPGEGSTFVFRVEMEHADRPPPAVDPIPFPGLTGRRALVVDAHPFSLQVIRELLARWGMDTRAADSTAGAIARTADWQPQVVLLDSGFAGPADVDFARRQAARGAAVFLLAQPGDSIPVRERFGEAAAGTLFKPLKVSPLFNALLAHAGPRLAAPAPRAGPTPRVLRPDGQPPRLLLAEDNAINRKLALAALVQMGCTADVAVDGAEALRAAQAARYDAILMDVQMPGLDGLEATRRLRQWEAATGTPRSRVIALTANALSGDRETCLAAGMDDYLAKPIRLEALRSALRHAVLQNAGGVAAPAAPAPEASPAEQALRRLADDLSPADAASLAADFLASLDDQRAALRDAVRLRNGHEAMRLAHGLKGTAGIFGLDALQREAERLETAGRAQDNPAATAALQTLELAAAAAESSLRAALTALGPNPATEPMS